MQKSYFLVVLLLTAMSHNIRSQHDGDHLIYPYAFAPSEGYVKKIESSFREEICLNGRWDFQPVALPADYRRSKGVTPELPLPDANAWDAVKIKIPSPWNINSFANNNLEGPDHRNYPSYPDNWNDVKMAWMRKTVTIPAGWAEKNIFLHFEAVAGFTEVYVNAKKVSENFDLFLPFNVDITEAVKPGETVEILVGVRNQSLFEDNSTIGRRIVPAGSMWGYHVSGIWQDVFLVAIPAVHISNVFIKPAVSKGLLEAEVEIQNPTAKEVRLSLAGDVRKWINKAGTGVNLAPVPAWELATAAALSVPVQKVTVPAKATQKITVSVPVQEGLLDYWTPETPNLYGLTLTLNDKNAIDVKYERFGWREWTFDGTRQLLNGKPVELRGDSWHFMGVPQLTRRYAWAWFTALKDANANAVRPHAQIYPQFYLDMADEMGICVLAETAIWASDGGPKMDSPVFWENCKEHIRRMVLRDRNHAGVFGWSVSNENKPVILNVFNRPDLMPFQKEAWTAWRDIVRENDPTRPWISSDGEDDGEGILPTTMGHYGDNSSMKHWQSIGKPWGVGEHSMAYYGTPEQVAKYNGERAYESQLGRMEGLAYECYDLVARQREMGASYVSVFNIAWYGLQPLPFGKRDLTSVPTLDDGIYFADYREGVPGIQPERMGPYCSTFNPGYDATLPLYITWPMFDAIKAANAPEGPAWSCWATMPQKPAATLSTAEKQYRTTGFTGAVDSPVKKLFEAHGIVFSEKIQFSGNTLIIMDGAYTPDAKEIMQLQDWMSKGADLWLWCPVPANLEMYGKLLTAGSLELDARPASSFIPEPRSWMRGMLNSDFYFSEIQQDDVSFYGMKGSFVDEGIVLLNACNTNWRRWNRCPEELKTAAVLRSENESKGASPVFVKRQNGSSTVYVSALSNFTATEKGYNTMEKLLAAAGISSDGKKISEKLIDDKGFVKIDNLFERRRDNKAEYSFWIWSPRPLDDLLIEPDMPKLDLMVKPAGCEIRAGRSTVEITDGVCRALALKQGWNRITVSVPAKEKSDLSLQFKCENKPEFVKQLKTDFKNPDE